MTPRMTKHNAIDGSAAYAKGSANGAAGHRGGHASDFPYVILGNHGEMRVASLDPVFHEGPRLVTKNFVRVQDVFQPRAPLQIVWGVIQFVAVKVIDLMSFRAWAMKGEGNKLMEGEGLVPFVPDTFLGSQVAPGIRASRHEATRASNTPKAAGLVFLMAGNRFPNLNHVASFGYVTL